MNITIGGRPLSKVIAGYVTAVVVDGIAIVIDAASKDWSMTREGWITLLVGSFGPPTAAYLRKFSTRDASQVIQAVAARPEGRQVIESELKLGGKVPY